MRKARLAKFSPTLLRIRIIEDRIEILNLIPKVREPAFQVREETLFLILFSNLHKCEIYIYIYLYIWTWKSEFAWISKAKVNIYRLKHQTIPPCWGLRSLASAIFKKIVKPTDQYQHRWRFSIDVTSLARKPISVIWDWLAGQSWDWLATSTIRAYYPWSQT
jgi:hypothetical protein